MPQAGAPPTTPQPPLYGPSPTPPPPPTAKTLMSSKLVLKAAATTAKALAHSRVTAPQGTAPAHRRGGRPLPTRKERPRAQPHRLRRSAVTPAPRVTGTHTATQSRRTQQGQHDPATANSPWREGQARPQLGAPIASSNRAATSAMPATHFAPPLSPAVTRRNGRGIADFE